MKNYTISQYIEKQNALHNTKFSDNFTDRFMANLEGVSHYEDGTYLPKDLDEAWGKSGSDNVYNDHGISSI